MIIKATVAMESIELGKSKGKILMYTKVYPSKPLDSKKEYHVFYNCREFIKISCGDSIIINTIKYNKRTIYAKKIEIIPHFHLFTRFRYSYNSYHNIYK
jgi:hypothetical protein